MAELKSLRVERTDHVAEVTLLGPGKGNAMGPDFWHELPVVFDELSEDSEVRAIVLTGSGQHFSYGLDLPAMLPTWGEALGAGALAGPRTDFLREIRRLQGAITSVAACRKPVIAAVSGWCIGGGVDLISAADIRLASADAKFSVREVKVAIVADIGSLQRLAGIIGEGHLRDRGEPTSGRARRQGDPQRGAGARGGCRVAARLGVERRIPAERGPDGSGTGFHGEATGTLQRPLSSKADSFVGTPG